MSKYYYISTISLLYYGEYIISLYIEINPIVYDNKLGKQEWTVVVSLLSCDLWPPSYNTRYLTYRSSNPR